MKSERSQPERARGKPTLRPSRAVDHQGRFASFACLRTPTTDWFDAVRLAPEKGEDATAAAYSGAMGAPQWLPFVVHGCHGAPSLMAFVAHDAASRTEWMPSSATEASPEVARLRDEIRALREEVAEMKAAFGWHDETVIPLDPWQAWINAHPQEIARYPGEHIAVHPERGIVHHDSDGRAFAAWYRELSEEEAETYLITTSSMCL